MKAEIKTPGYKQKNVLLTDITLPEDPERQRTDPDYLEVLMDSIKEIGLINPVTLLQNNNKLILKAGWCRFQAFQKLNRKTIPARIIDTNEATAEQITLDENFIRDSINPVDEALWLARLKEKKNLSNKSLAEMINKSESFVVNSLKLTELNEYLVKGVLNDKITPLIALELNKITDDIERERQFNHTIEYGYDLKYVKDQVHKTNFDLQQKKLNPNKNENVETKHPVFEAPAVFCELCENKIHGYEYKFIKVCLSCHTSAKANLGPE